MRVLVTGGNGFVGGHLLAELAANGHHTVVFDLTHDANRRADETLIGDLREPGTAERIVAEAHPDACVHLAAMAFVPDVARNPARALEINVAGTLAMLEAIHHHAPQARLLFVSTAQIYAPSPDGRPLDEDAPLRPFGTYAVSKAAADLATLAYAERRGLAALTARPNTHIGPGQSPQYVAASFVEQVAALATSVTRRGVLEVGNLESRRDFIDVRDVVRAYRLLLERGVAGRAYNIAGSRTTTIRELLDTLCDIAGVSPEIRVDPEKYRPTDCSPMLDTTRLRADTGWTPEYTLEQTLRDMLAEVRPV